MSAKRAILGVAGAAAMLLAVGAALRHPRGDAPPAVEVTSGPIEVWSVYDGFLESREVRNIMSQMGGGGSAIVELVPDGSPVQDGDVLARLDSAQWEREVLSLERDYLLARSDLDTLRNAKLPLELADIESRAAEARRQAAEEAQALVDTRSLLAEQLVSEQEVRQQEYKALEAKTKLQGLEQQLELTRSYLHPGLLERARATVASAERELNYSHELISNCVIRAPAGGIVAYKSIPVAGEFRTVRVGDLVYRNQPFMTVSDMSNLVIRCDVPEAELTRVRVGSVAVVRPVAYPDLSASGRVDTVGSMAQTLAGRPGSQKYFNVVIAVEEGDPRLRSGMSAQARIRSHAATNAVLLPRAAVFWKGDAPYARAVTGSRVEERRLTLGPGNETHFEVFDGIRPGERVRLR